MAEDISKLKAIRRKVRLKLKIYADKHYDARPILKLYNELCDIIGDRSDLDYTAQEYWDNPSNRDRQEYNRQPVVRYKGSPRNGYRFIYKTVKPKKSKTTKTKTASKSNVLNVAINDYVISICGDIKKYPKIREALVDLGLKYAEDNPNKLSCKISDTEEGYKRLKRSLIIILDLISGNSFEIGVIGHKV